MTTTHMSHFGLTFLRQTETSVVLCGTLANCRRIAFAHGMEVESYEGFIVSSNNGHAVTTPADAKNFSRCLFKNGGLIQKGQNDYSIVIPLTVWNEKL